MSDVQQHQRDRARHEPAGDGADESGERVLILGTSAPTQMTKPGQEFGKGIYVAVVDIDVGATRRRNRVKNWRKKIEFP